ncbi:MAG: sensor histidine kinase [Lachnospiraceae bacterium]
MKRAIILEYLKTILFAVLMSVAVSMLICFLCFFNNQTVDNDMPQYLIRRMEQYIKITEKGMTLDQEGKKSLQKYQLWMQVVDEDGTVVYEVDVPKKVPKHYSNFQLVDSVLHSNQLGEYTIFASSMTVNDHYGILLGCDSGIVTKYTYSFEGNGRDLILKCLFVFCVTTVSVIIAVSYYFSKKVTAPIGRALEMIEEIQTGNSRDSFPIKNKKLFANVFVSIDKLKAALKENERLRAEWITNISHDIKTPLSTIKGYAELLSTEDYEFEKEEMMGYADQILKSEKRIEELVEDLKMSQMLVEGKIKLKKEKVELVKLLENCIAETKIYIKGEPAIHFTYDKTINILADKKLLERSFVNIICNAYVHNEKNVCVDISLSEEENDAKIVIADNGRGIKKEDLAHIFERYYRGTDSGKEKGTGLGLAIAKEVITEHGGKILVSSEKGEGTRFIIYLKKNTE